MGGADGRVVIRKEPFEIMLHECIEDTEHRRESPQGNDDYAPGQPRHSQTKRAHAHDAVDACFEEHA